MFNKLAAFVDLPKQYGYALGTNGSLTKEYEIDNGSENIRHVSSVKSWMNMTTLNPIWRSVKGFELCILTDGNLSTFSEQKVQLKKRLFESNPWY